MLLRGFFRFGNLRMFVKISVKHGIPAEHLYGHQMFMSPVVFSLMSLHLMSQISVFLAPVSKTMASTILFRADRNVE